MSTFDDANIGSKQIVVIGVSGSGKSTVGAALAKRLGRTFVDGDDLHSADAVALMTAGTPLTDADRWPWLARIRSVLRGDEPVVIACSALRRRYRDLLRQSGNVVFVHLDIDEQEAEDRLGQRQGHFMRAGMVQSQFDALERASADETDVAVVGEGDLEMVVDRAAALVRDLQPGASTVPLLAEGSPDHRIDRAELDALVVDLARTEILDRGCRRVLLVPPDQTRLHSQAGPITVRLRDELMAAGCEVGVLPALGTHVAMGDDAAALLFGTGLRADELLVHDWRDGLRHRGEIRADEVAAVTAGRFVEPVDVAVDAQLFEDWDLVVSVGQVVPHEVIGMANFTKNLIVGLGGAPTIHRSHWVGAVCGMESIMGRASSPVRDLLDAAFDRFVAPDVDVLWLLSVVEDTADGAALRGLFAGRGGSDESGGAAYRAAAALAAQVNVEVVEAPLDRAVCWLDPEEMHSTWLGNKAIYRTRMAMADEGELVVLAPGVRRFGEDDQVDALIRRHGYRGTPATMAAVDADPALAANLSAAAHLIHGSSEGRFRIVYCTDPATGGLTEQEVTSVGFEWRPLADELDRLGVTGTEPTGPRADRDGAPYFYVANPALGLWSVGDVRTSG